MGITSMGKVIVSAKIENMDWVVDPIGQRLMGNPAHGGEQMIELFSFV